LPPAPPRFDVFESKVFIRKLFSIDALAARAVAPREVAALAHEGRDDAVELRPAVVQGYPPSRAALLALCAGEHGSGCQAQGGGCRVWR